MACARAPQSTHGAAWSVLCTLSQVGGTRSELALAAAELGRACSPNGLGASIGRPWPEYLAVFPTSIGAGVERSSARRDVQLSSSRIRHEWGSSLHRAEP